MVASVRRQEKRASRRVSSQPRPMNGIVVAISVMN